ncbi:cytochrome c oxidase assembly protein [Candidatus Gracilibacteria bacterium]|nr:cytochrome c oxidase assembly protein [Candidatus Gracilibacteria bacterium]
MGHHTAAASLSVVTLIVWAGLLAFAGAYALAAGCRKRRRWSGRRSVSWYVGLGLLGLAFAPPLAASAHHDLRAHMVQHLLVGMVAPLALVLAAPLTLALRTMPVRYARRIVAVLHSQALCWLIHPLSALVLNVGVLYALYLTPLYALSQQHIALHLMLHGHMFLAGFLFTSVIAGLDSGAPTARWSTRLAVLFVAIAAMQRLLSGCIAAGGRRAAGHDLAQIQAAAQLMYYGGDGPNLFLR